MKEISLLNTTYNLYLQNSVNIDLYQVDPGDKTINSQFKSCKKWINAYIGPATAELHGINDSIIRAIKDENRNAVLPDRSVKIQNNTFYLAVKGCGAYEDMFSGDLLTPSKIKQACRDNSYLDKIENLSTGQGFIMSESWMGESPYGAQGHMNALDELAFSIVANGDSINGACICPVIGVIQLPLKIEEVARKFFWFRTYNDHFYQVLRLMPSNVRLYFESTKIIADPNSIFSLFGLDSSKKIEQFELNFIKSGIALLSLYTRSAKKEGENVTGIVYRDVWLDKDCVVAPNGIIYFADLEGLIWKSVPLTKFKNLQTSEWQKLVFEFLFALVNIDSYRHELEGLSISWEKQREELALFIQLALENDLFSFPILKEENLHIVIESEIVPKIEIPLLEKVNSPCYVKER